MEGRSMNRRTPLLLISVAVLACMIVSGCSRDASRLDTSGGGTDISRVDLCGWVNASTAAMGGTFGVAGPAAAATAQTIRRSGDVTAVTCEVRSLGTGGIGQDETLGEVTLIRGGEAVKDANPRGVAKKYSHGSYEGLSAEADYPPAALVAVQLEDGLVLNVEGFRAGSNVDMSTTSAAGTEPLMAQLLDQRDSHHIGEIPKDSMADAWAFCDSLGIPSSRDNLGVSAGDKLVISATGEPNTNGSTLGGVVDRGRRDCKMTLVDPNPGSADIWPWNSPFGQEREVVDIEFFGFGSDDDAASAAAGASTFPPGKVAAGKWAYGASPLVQNPGTQELLQQLSEKVAAAAVPEAPAAGD
ncbi:hypothetical protein A0130_02730 [Leifsonia xyli]|nr:hypothetical protein A0130_02730 [Leifsonia xyli]